MRIVSTPIQAPAPATQPEQPRETKNETLYIETASPRVEETSFWKRHGLKRNLTLVGVPIALFGAGELTGMALQKSTEKAVTAAVKLAVNQPAFIKATLEPQFVKAFPALMGKGSTAVNAIQYSKGLHTAVQTKLSQSVALTMDQAVATGSFVGSGKAVAVIEGKATQYTGKMAHSLGKYGDMFIDYLSIEKAQPYVTVSSGNYTGSAFIKADINVLSFDKSSETVRRMTDGVNQAARQVRQGAAMKTTIVTPDAASHVAKATEETVLKTSQSKLGKAHQFLTSSKTGTIAMGALLTGLTVWDAWNAVEKTSQESTSTTGKVLAWTTVGLDAAALGSFALQHKSALPLIGLAIGTSVAASLID